MPLMQWHYERYYFERLVTSIALFREPEKEGWDCLLWCANIRRIIESRVKSLDQGDKKLSPACPLAFYLTLACVVTRLDIKKLFKEVG